MVNLLPWRQQRQRRFWRFWCLLLSGSVFVIGLLAVAQHRLLDVNRATLRVIQDAGTRQLVLLADHHRRLDLRQKQAEAIAVRLQQQAQTGGWQQILVEIAARLPAKIWLTQLEYRQSILLLTGYSLTLSDLRRLDAALAAIPGLQDGRAGKTHRDAQGRWRFYYQLNRVMDRAAAH